MISSALVAALILAMMITLTAPRKYGTLGLMRGLNGLVGTRLSLRDGLP